MGRDRYRPRVLIVDSYDSFTHNLAALVVKAFPFSEVHIIHNNDLDQRQLLEYLPYFLAVIVGPGPGSPEIAADIGIVKDLWHLPESHLLPVFGVCLGLQSLAVEFGAKLLRLDVVKHGQISRIEHNGDALFKGIPHADVVRYHSLHVTLEADAKSSLQELAWADDGAENGGRVVMALKHKSLPFWAVQYHPESVRTDASGLNVLQNFALLALLWCVVRRRQVRSWDAKAQSRFTYSWPYTPLLYAAVSSERPLTVVTSALHIPQVCVKQLCECIGVGKNAADFVLLDSAAKPGRYSIIGCLHSSTLKITYFVGDDYVTLQRAKQRSIDRLANSDIWAWLASFMGSRHAKGGNEEIPFWGGLIGYFSYEIGVESIDRQILSRTTRKQRRHPDVNLAFVERCIVMDNQTGNVFVQSIIPGDDDWFADMSSILRRAAARGNDIAVTGKPRAAIPPGTVHVVLPDKDRYIAKVNNAKEHLSEGNSYELCVTARTRIRLPVSSSWELYKALRSVNPAPHAAYLRLHPTTLVSSSPERFLSVSRGPGRRCELRPIKGTVRKGGNMTRARAEEILGSPKEIAENLMIVDLIRHDLHGVVGCDVEVTKFCGIEEFETVWQLVSVIEGAPSLGACGDEIGWDALRRSLPPGSMTGAPKKRSVEILQELEDDERSVYSGVAGYYCVSGASDWSVVIRSCFKFDELADGGSDGTEEWVLGAGGAVTALSDPEAEWDEMIVKLQSVLRAFGKDG